MYEEYFGLKKKPFSIVPDPGYFYMSEGHREALAHLMFVTQSDGGFVLLTGEVGTGKTTVCRRFLQVMPDDTEVAFILNPRLTSDELLASICDEFGIRYPDGTTSVKTLVSCINDYLLDLHQKGRKAVLIIEEAQNLSSDVLEQIRLLTNLETNHHKLLKMIMLGQPELRQMLSRPQLRQLSQRITAWYHLGSLPKNQIAAYVNYRLEAAGHGRGQLFSPQALKKLPRLTGGVPRLINAICDRALLGAFVQGKDRIDVQTLAAAAREVTGKNGKGRPTAVAIGASVAVICLILSVVLGAMYYIDSRKPLAVRSAAAVPSQPVVQEEAKTIPLLEMLNWPAGQMGEETMRAAYAALFSEWRAVYEREKGNVCQQAEDHGLRCLSGRGNIADLRQMNTPAVLTFVNGKNEKYFGTVTALKGEIANVTIGGTAGEMDVRGLADAWTGEYLVLWRVPVQYSGNLQPGSRGPLVGWLATQLAEIGGETRSEKPPAVYDGQIVEQVKELQTAVGITPDGIVGPQTIIRLNSARGGADPVLAKAESGQ
jgi:general secretion pathway protein A